MILCLKHTPKSNIPTSSKSFLHLPKKFQESIFSFKYPHQLYCFFFSTQFDSSSSSYPYLCVNNSAKEQEWIFILLLLLLQGERGNLVLLMKNLMFWLSMTILLIENLSKNYSRNPLAKVIVNTTFISSHFNLCC